MSMVKKSQATIVAAWLVRNWRHVGARAAWGRIEPSALQDQPYRLSRAPPGTRARRARHGCACIPSQGSR